MTKKTVKDRHWSGITNCLTLGEVKEEIDNLVEKYGHDADVHFDSGYNNIDEYVEFFRMETDNEYQKRLKAKFG